MYPEENGLNEKLDALLRDAGWVIQGGMQADFRTRRKAVVLRDFPLSRGCGKADYLFFIDGKAAGLIEVRPSEGLLNGLDPSEEKYRRGLPFSLPLYTRPLPFLYESNGQEIVFTNGFDPDLHPRRVFSFHRPETLKAWMEEGLVGGVSRDMATDVFPEYGMRGMTLKHRLWINMPALSEASQESEAIKSLETALRQGRFRVLLPIGEETDRLSLAARAAGRLIRFAGAGRVLYLLEARHKQKAVVSAFQRHLAQDACLEFRKALPLRRIKCDGILSERVCIASPEEVYGLLPKTLHRGGTETENRTASARDLFPSLQYTPNLPIESFDLIFVDDATKGDLAVLTALAGYFDARFIGFSDAELDEKRCKLFQEPRHPQNRAEDHQHNQINTSFEL